MTHRIVAAAEDPDLKWIRSLTVAPVGAQIYGSVARRLPGVEVSLVGPVSRKVISDSEGKFSASGLPPGRYNVSAPAPTGFTSTPSGSVEVVNGQCTEVLLYPR
jgi:hypothetical protein